MQKCNGSVFLALQIASSQLLVCNSAVTERDKQQDEIKRADLWKEITGKDAVIYKEGWGDQYKMLFVTTYESMGETEEVGEKVMADKRVTDWLQNGMTNGDLISGAVDRFFTTIKDTRD